MDLPRRRHCRLLRGHRGGGGGGVRGLQGAGGALQGSAVLQCNQGVQEGDLVMCRLATEARYRGRGVASQLLARLERTASILGCARVTLETSTSHEAAVRLYTRRGYTQVLRCIYVCQCQ